MKMIVNVRSLPKIMDNHLATLSISADAYQQLQALATEANRDPIQVIQEMIADAYQRKLWLNDLTHLRQQIQQEDGLNLGETQEEVINKLHQIRQEIFETDYADLY